MTHDTCLFFVEHGDLDEAIKLALCVWAGCPSVCPVYYWPPPDRVTWSAGIWWDYVDVVDKIWFPREHLDAPAVVIERLEKQYPCPTTSGKALASRYQLMHGNIKS